MDYWNSLCNLNDDLLLLFDVTDYKDPFIRATSTGPFSSVDIPAVLVLLHLLVEIMGYIFLFLLLKISIE